MGTHYDVLGVPRNATFEQIKKAYREQIKFFHPDVFDGPPEVAEIKTRQLNEAYSVLIDPVKRRAYDAGLFEKERRQNAGNREDKESPSQSKEETQAGTDNAKSRENPNVCNEKENETEPQQQKKARKTKVVISVLVVLLVFSLAWSAAITHKSAVDRIDAQNEIARQKNITKAYEKEITLQKNKNNNAMLEIKNLKEENKQLNESKEVLYGIADEWAFWRSSAVIVTQAGSKYHTYGCSHIGENGFYIFNVETAKVRGYAPCLDCDPPPWS